MYTRKDPSATQRILQTKERCKIDQTGRSVIRINELKNKMRIGIRKSLAAKYGFMMFLGAIIKQGIANKKALLHKRDLQKF
jgi:hypothetical protein